MADTQPTISDLVSSISGMRLALAHLRLMLEYHPNEPIDQLLRARHELEIPPPGKIAIQTIYADGRREWELRDDG